jgi:rhodanese-related sulfurtransferase
MTVTIFHPGATRTTGHATAPVVIDVRDNEEYAAGHIPGALHIPGDVLGQRLAEVPHGRTVVAY